ncbi:hypothetical protein KJ359_001706 [Pestalotiopsis sp. 9143b]|nr:hypothetical protein KJ359_001706 [Pestalotiopsis sp. 9143b]
MAETRSRRTAKRAYTSQEQDRTRKRQRRDIPQSSREPVIQQNHRKRPIEENDSTSQPTFKRARRPKSSIDDRADKIANYPIYHWIQKGHWPRGYLKADMEHALARKRSTSSLRRKRSDSASSATPSDQRPREEKSAPYRDSRYETLLATKGVFMGKSKSNITSESKTLCKNLLETNQAVPENSLFHDDRFESTCQKIHNRNEARVIQDISRLIVPSAESLATMGATHLEDLVESVNEGWNNSIPLTGTRPQPDYSVGFQREAFTDEQHDKLSPFIGEFLGGDLSFFMATYYIYFPFLACEVKCGAAALDIADRQNTHSMTLAARGIVELFRLVKREDEINRQILSFSISHDHRSVRIYGYYPVIEGKDTKYYRHPIHTFDFTTLDGKDKWSAYRFTKNIYDIWMPEHFKKICSAIDDLPSDLNFEVPALSESTGLSQHLESLGRSEADSASVFVDKDNQSLEAGEMESPATSFSKQAPPPKRRRSPVKKA